MRKRKNIPQTSMIYRGINAYTEVNCDERPDSAKGHVMQKIIYRTYRRSSYAAENHVQQEERGITTLPKPESLPKDGRAMTRESPHPAAPRV